MMLDVPTATAGNSQAAQAGKAVHAAPEGLLTITLGAQRVSISSTRPLFASRLLVGKTPQQVLQLVPMLFSICGHAQTRASHLALRAALSEHAAPSAAHPFLCQLEVLREGLLRILRTPAIGHDIPTTRLQQVLAESMRMGRQLQPLLALQESHSHVLAEVERFEQLLATSLFGQSCADFAASTDADAIIDWIRQCEHSAARHSAALLDAAWASQGNPADPCPPLGSPELPAIASMLLAEDGDDYIAQPRWHGRSHETGTLARLWQHPVVQQLRARHGSGLLTRRIATLLELAGIPARLRECLQHNTARPDAGAVAGQQHSLARHSGIAAVEAARGHLVHLVALANGLVSDYRILAPTEWNFHPDGPVARGLAGLRTESVERRELLARHLVHAVDPCVGYQLELC